MEISKTNGINFTRRQRQGRKSALANNSTKHKNKSGLLLLGLTVSGAIAAAAIIHKKKDIIPSVINKIKNASSLINDKIQNIPEGDKSAKAIENNFIDSSVTANEKGQQLFNAGEPAATKSNVSLKNDKTVIADDKDALITADSLNEAESATIKDGKTIEEDIFQENNNVTEKSKAVEEETILQENNEILEADGESLKFDEDDELTREVDEFVKSTEEKAAKNSEYGDSQDILKSMLEEENEEPFLLDKNEADISFKKADIPETKKIQKRPEEIAYNQEANEELLDSNMRKYPRLYQDFGIDEEIASAFKKLDPKITEEMDNEFISLLLAPTDKINVSFDEKMQNGPYRSRAQYMLEHSLLKGTERAKKHRMQSRRLSFSYLVQAVLSTDQRVDKLEQLESVFTPEELHKILNSDSIRPSRLLLKWLMEFHTKAVDANIVDEIKRFVNPKI